MGKVVLLTLLYANLVMASSDCLPKVSSFAHVHEFAKGVEAIVKEVKKPWSAVSDEQVQGAKCRSLVPSVSHIEESLKTKKQDREITTLYGLEITDDSLELVNSLKKLLTPSIDMNEEKSKRFDLSKEEFKKCKSSVCVAKTIFGNELGPKLLYLIHNYGLNGSHYAHTDARPWKADELDAYIQGAMDLPSFILPMRTNKRFVHSKRTNGKTLANASMTFFGGIDDLTKQHKTYTTFHELSHYVSFELEITRSPQWLEAGDWRVDLQRKFYIEQQRNNTISGGVSAFILPGSKKKTKRNKDEPFIFGRNKDDQELNILESLHRNSLENDIFYQATVSDRPDEIISKYGETNPAEDFAETMSAYRYNAKELKKVSLKKYQFMKDHVFGGIEYEDEQNCRDDQSKFFKHIEDFKKWSKDNTHLISRSNKDYRQCPQESDYKCKKINTARQLKALYVESLKLDDEKKQDLTHTLQRYSN